MEVSAQRMLKWMCGGSELKTNVQKREFAIKWTWQVE